MSACVVDKTGVKVSQTIINNCAKHCPFPTGKVSRRWLYCEDRAGHSDGTVRGLTSFSQVYDRLCARLIRTVAVRPAGNIEKEIDLFDDWVFVYVFVII